MPQRNVKGLSGLATSKMKDVARSGVKRLSKWATSPPKQTLTKAMGSNYNEPIPGYVREGMQGKPTVGKLLKASVPAVTDVHRAGLGYIKKAAQAAGEGAARIAYGPIEPTPKSVKSNIKRKK